MGRADELGSAPPPLIGVPLRDRLAKAFVGASAGGDGYGAAVLIAVLLFSDTAVAKLAAHAITSEEVRQVNDGDRVVIGSAQISRYRRDR